MGPVSVNPSQTVATSASSKVTIGNTSYGATPGSSMTVWIVVGVVALAGIGGLIWYFARRKK